MRKIITLLLIFVSMLGFDLWAEVMPGDTVNVAYKLHGQTRRFKFTFQPASEGGLTLHWSIVRNLKLWTGTYAMTPKAVKDADSQSYLMPEDGNHVMLPSNETFGIISQSALRELKAKCSFTYNGVEYEKTGNTETPLGEAIEVYDEEEGARMQILDNPSLPLILSMTDNPLEINWNFYP